MWVKYLESPFSNEEKLLPQCSLNSRKRLPGLDILGGRNYRNRHEWHWRKFSWKVFGKSKNCSNFEMQTIQTNSFSSNFRANPRFLILTRSVRLSKRPIIRYIYVRSVNVVINHAIWVRLYPNFNTYVFRHALVLFVIKTHYPSGRTWANICSSFGFVTTVKRRMMHVDELSLVMRRVSRRISKDTSSRRIMRLVPVFLLRTHRFYECLFEFVQTDKSTLV